MSREAAGKLRALIVTENFPPSIGGVQSYWYNTISNFRNVASTVICRHDPHPRCEQVDESLVLHGHRICRVHHIPQNRGLTAALKSVRQIAQTCRLVVDVIQRDKISLLIFGHTNFFNLLVLFLVSLRLKVRIGIVFHGEDIPVIYLRSNRLFRFLIRQADLHICNSRFTLERLHRFHEARASFYVAYPGVEDRFFQPVDVDHLARRYGTRNRKVLLTVGRLDPRKGHAQVIEALPRIVKAVPEVLYLIGGTGQQAEPLKTKVAEHNLEGHVTFCGFIPEEDIVAFHQLAHVFVMPNRVMEDGDTEGFGIVFMEANACGKPVIGGACGGSLDAIEDGRSGFLVDPADLTALSDKIVYLLTHPQEARQMGDYGRQRAWEQFRWPYLAAKLEEHLMKAV